ncbi:rhamnan synthesis F family protein [Erwinia endophytica]|uniref:rhamnan synthesis F family protein n=1 Tax=Erwinia endophytica TaxID=1563158 RepID=UPI001F0377D9|nr:rhamnan synthesis F family protein [Erwinia endophytica]
MFLKVILFSYYGFLSFRDGIKIKKYQNIVHKKEYNGQKVMLLALYEKSQLRSDTVELLKAAKKQDIYIIAVNTLKLKPECYFPELIDIYIERENYGRDFGSYQTGMNYFYKSKISESCSRLLIINDSVFFSLKGLDEFISQLFSTDLEVLGATENSQHSHHLGSFCVSVCGNIARDKKFENFWKNYKSSNVRPLVIKRGEFALSKLLKSLVSSEQQFKSLYNVLLLEKKLKSDPYILDNYFYFRREGDRAWSNKNLLNYFEEDRILKSFLDDYISKCKLENRDSDYVTKKDEDEKEINYIDFLSFISRLDYKTVPFGNILQEKLIALYMEEFTWGSQIHINCLIMHYLGLPIIKLDLLFRCVCNMNDLIKLRDQLDESQQDEFMALMSTRLCGDKFLVGFNRLAYQHGIL